MEGKTEANKSLPNEKINDTDRTDLEIIAIGKRTGLTLQEMNEMRVRDLFAYAEIYSGGGKKKKQIRWATQEDIDRFLG